MKYVWIVMLIIFDLLWFISVLLDIKHAIDLYKENTTESGSFSLYDDIIVELDDTSRWWFTLHMIGLFIVSFATWISNK